MLALLILDAFGKECVVLLKIVAGADAMAAGSTIPNLGASGAMAGVMGACLVTDPRDNAR